MVSAPLLIAQQLVRILRPAGEVQLMATARQLSITLPPPHPHALLRWRAHLYLDELLVRRRGRVLRAGYQEAVGPSDARPEAAPQAMLPLRSRRAGGASYCAS